jgi:hypothetical protein
MIPEGNPPSWLDVAHVGGVRTCAAQAMRFNNQAWAAGVMQNKCPQCARFRRRAAWPPSATPHASSQGALALDHGRCLAHTKTNAHGKKARLASRRGLRSGYCSRSRTPEEHSVAAATTKNNSRVSSSSNNNSSNNNSRNNNNNNRNNNNGGSSLSCSLSPSLLCSPSTSLALSLSVSLAFS